MAPEVPLSLEKTLLRDFFIKNHVVLNILWLALNLSQCFFLHVLWNSNFLLFLAEIDIIPVGSNLVKLWGVEAGLFLMIDDAGQLRGTVSLLFHIYRMTKQGITDVDSHSVHGPSLFAGERGLTWSQRLEGVAGKEGGDFFQGGVAVFA